MELKKVLNGLEGLKAKGNLDLEIAGVESDSRQVKNGYLFVAIVGFETDGHQYINNAIENGATAIMIQEGVNYKELEIPEDITIIAAPDTRLALALLAANFYEHPSQKFKLIGITGTKGKTTTSYMIKEILQKQGYKVGLMGTIATYLNDTVIEESDRTTPESTKIQKTFAYFAKEKVDAVVMEVSSQSLKLNRVAGCDFDISIFTNLSEDHISPNEHPDMQDYFASKVKLFLGCKTGFINSDDIYSIRIPKLAPDCEITTYGIDNSCNLLAKDITITNSYVDFKVKLGERNERVKVCIPGRFSVYNSLAAICATLKLGCTPENIKEALLEVRVPGRSEMVDNKLELPIMIDYAHSPESLESILAAVKSYTRGRVICVFGCGGDRDTAKRPVMGEISGRIADYTILTSDNPRTEDPHAIIQEIEAGIKKTKGNYEVVVDRTEAIKKAIVMANKKDIIVLAGKGHETYQEVNHEKHPYDERTIIKQLVDEVIEEIKHSGSKKAKQKLPKEETEE